MESIKEPLPTDNQSPSSLESAGQSNRGPDDYHTPPAGLREYLFIAVLCSTQLFVQGSFGYILLPLHIVGQTFGQTAQDASTMTWHVAGYSLTVGTFILIAGRLGDIHGSKHMLVAGWIWFGVWTIIGGCSAFTGSAIFFDVARAFQGIGPAFLLPNALAIAGRTYPPGRKKNAIFSIFALAAPLGCSTAGATGAAFAEYVWWPWVMWVYAIGCFVIAATGYFVIPADRKHSGGPEQHFDWLGSIFGVVGLLLLNISWNQAPIVGWQTPYVIVLLILGFVFLALFVWQERRTPQPLLDMAVFNRHVAFVLAVTGLGWASFGIWFYYLFQFIQRFRGVSPLDSAAQFAPGAVSGIIAAIATAYLLAAIPTSWLMAVASGAFFVGCLLQATAPVQQSYWFNTFWSFVVMAWGMDISFPASATVLSNSVPVKHQGISASLVNTVVNYSIAIGLGIAGTVEAQVNGGGERVLEGYRWALWTSVILSGIGLMVASSYALTTQIWPRKRSRGAQDHKELAESGSPL